MKHKIPEVIYHGTSETRLKNIRWLGLNGNAPTLYVPNPKHPKNYFARGYVYLAGEEKSASYYALKATESEHRLSPEEKTILGLEHELYQAIVIPIRTSDLTGIEADPEARSGEIWFRYKGTIHPRHSGKIRKLKPLEQQDQEHKDHLEIDFKITGAYGDYDPKKYADGLLSIMPEYPTWKKGFLDWMKKYDNDFYTLVVAELQSRGENWA